MPSPWKHANEGDNTGGQRESKQRKKDLMKVPRRQSNEGRASRWHSSKGKANHWLRAYDVQCTF